MKYLTIGTYSLLTVISAGCCFLFADKAESAMTEHSSIVFAGADPKNLNFYFTIRDIPSQILPKELNDSLSDKGFDTTRTYNSKSTYSGIFGFGWCSALETAAEDDGGAEIRVKHCGAGQEMLFRHSAIDFTAKVDQIFKQIINHPKFPRDKAEAKEENAIERLHDDISADFDLRKSFIASYKLVAMLPEGTYLSSDRQWRGQLTKHGFSIQNISSGEGYTFARNGRLTSYFMPVGRSIYVLQGPTGPVSVRMFGGSEMLLHYNASAKVDVVTVRTPKGRTEISYEYETVNEGNEHLAVLKAINVNAKNLLRYKYSDKLNLIEAWENERLIFSVSYDEKKDNYEKKDWVTKVTYQDGCVSSYTVAFSSTKPNASYVTREKLACPGKREAIIDHQYSEQDNRRQKAVSIPNGLIRLDYDEYGVAAIKVDSDEVLRIRSKSGLPLALHENDRKVIYSRSLGCRKPTVLRDTLGVRTVLYDADCNAIAIFDSYGLLARIKYVSTPTSKITRLLIATGPYAGSQFEFDGRSTLRYVSPEPEKLVTTMKSDSGGMLPVPYRIDAVHGYKRKSNQFSSIDPKLINWLEAATFGTELYDKILMWTYAGRFMGLTCVCEIDAFP